MEDYYRSTLPQLSPKLDADLAYYINGHWLQSISMFNAGEERERELFITRISAVIKTVAFSEHEEIFVNKVGHISVISGFCPLNDEQYIHERPLLFLISQQLYVIKHGLVGISGRAHTSGAHFGEEFIVFKHPPEVGHNEECGVGHAPHTAPHAHCCKHTLNIIRPLMPDRTQYHTATHARSNFFFFSPVHRTS
jgi:hypothetical protein